ncbi:MAG TPA: hypothetical protein VNP92_23745 [Actinophytocola sp.]|nr:hypothetical protein [Actinophytocola sp.]
MITTRPLLVAAVLAGVGLATVACDGTNNAAPPATETVTVAPDETSTPVADDGGTAEEANSGGSAGGQLPAAWPDQDFPIPPGVNVTARETATETGILLVGMDPGEVAAFYRDSLPAAGYEITKDTSVNLGNAKVVGMEFTGHGYAGKLAVVNSTVSISLQK